MKILHTSDWHLGRSLYGRRRYEEYEAFLDWLLEVIEDEKVDILLIAGDVFDTSTPGNRAQQLYYRFLSRVSVSKNCQYVVVIAGNHDSPTFLNAPRELLRALNVYVVGSMTETLEDEVIVLYRNEQPEVIVCAVPYLRDRDIRTMEPGETIDDKNRKLIEGLKDHYSKVAVIAEEKRKNILKSAKAAGKPLDIYIPIITMGHLFTSGGKTTQGDGVRELYVGTLAHVGVDAFPESIDYLALGHLHIPQKVGGAEHIRYCGSPLQMGFGEAGRRKEVVLVEFGSRVPEIREIAVPCFQELIRIEGSMDEIRRRLEELKDSGSSAWLEIEYTGTRLVPHLRETIDELLEGSNMEVRRIKNKQIIDRVIKSVQDEEALDDLSVDDVFIRCLDAYSVPEEERPGLTASYKGIIKSLYEDDNEDT